MNINEALESMEKSWKREEVLLKLQKGEDTEKIINDFFKLKVNEIKTFTKFISPQDKILLSNLQALSNCEAKLINKINLYCSEKNVWEDHKNKDRNTNQIKKNFYFYFVLFMVEWSNRMVFISLLVISAIALSKQAWA